MSDAVGLAVETGMRARMRALVESAVFRNSILGLIIINAVLLGLETSPTIVEATGDTLAALDHAILGIFVLELALRFWAYGLRLFRDPWAVFDMFVVGISLVPASESFSALRAIRVLRVLRIVSGVPRLRHVVEALLRAVPGIGAIGALLMLIFYVFSVIATNLFGERFPELFGTIGDSMYTLFQIMTLEGWSAEVVRPVMEVYPAAWTFFIPFIVVSTFTVLNLFLAIIVDSMNTLHGGEAGQHAHHAAHDRETVAQELARLRGEIRDLRTLLERPPR